MDNFISLISNADLESVLSGTFDLQRIEPSKHRNVFIMAAHCCLNGPVGTNKPTTFPLIQETISISGYIGNRVSNNSWKSFCRQIADTLVQRFPGVVARSQQQTVMGGLWPIMPSISEKRQVA